jgi:hypothetical protein
VVIGRGADHCPCQPRYSTGWPVLIACSTMSGGAGHATGAGDGLLQPLGVLPVGGVAPHPINGTPQPGHRRALERHHRPAAAPGHAGLVVSDRDRHHRHPATQRLQHGVEAGMGDGEGGALQGRGAVAVAWTIDYPLAIVVEEGLCDVMNVKLSGVALAESAGAPCWA